MAFPSNLKGTIARVATSRCLEQQMCTGGSASKASGSAKKPSGSAAKKASGSAVKGLQLKSRAEAVQAAAEAVANAKPLPLDLGQGLRLKS